ncbi:hypothetical protein P7K49_028591 [Saguinus oedipus]|uniref:Uncharacterized protein n=1 Tax=Saguinus oedipus TaxID=9490 RepID=A0ABQ9U5Z0_SAGOE|nr:hypothetical protein P7K49_028591 [Saguinus oedipus]
MDSATEGALLLEEFSLTCDSPQALKLFEDPDLGGAVPLGDSLLLPAACESGGPTPSLGHRDASEELFRYHLSPVALGSSESVLDRAKGLAPVRHCPALAAASSVGRTPGLWKVETRGCTLGERW